MAEDGTDYFEFDDFYMLLCSVRLRGSRWLNGWSIIIFSAKIAIDWLFCFTWTPNITSLILYPIVSRYPIQYPFFLIYNYVQCIPYINIFI